MADQPTTTDTPAPGILSTEPPPVVAPAAAVEGAPALYPADPTGNVTVTEPAPADGNLTAPVEPTGNTTGNTTEHVPVVEPVALTVESYADLKVPATISVDADQLTAFKTLAVDAALPPSEAQKFVDFYEQTLTSQMAALQTQWDARQTEYRTAIDAMPEFQGEQRAHSVAVLGRMIDEFGDASVRTFFAEAGDHPGVTKMLLSMASALTEDLHPASGRPPAQSNTRRVGTKALYPDTPTQ